MGAAAAGHAGVEGEAGRRGGARVAAPAAGGDVFEALRIVIYCNRLFKRFLNFVLNSFSSLIFEAVPPTWNVRSVS